MLSLTTNAGPGYPDATKTLASRSFVKELPLLPGLQNRNFKTTYSILNPGKHDSRASFGVLSTEKPVIFSIHSTPPGPGTQVLAFYEEELSSDSRRDGYVNEAWVYDDFSILSKQIMDGLHDSILHDALASVYQQQQGNDAALVFSAAYGQNRYMLNPAYRKYALDSLSQSMRLGYEGEGALFLTRVTLP